MCLDRLIQEINTVSTEYVTLQLGPWDRVPLEQQATDHLIQKFFVF